MKKTQKKPGAKSNNLDKTYHNHPKPGTYCAWGLASQERS